MSILIRRVVLRNYKSIGACKVDLSDLNLLVGPNGAGEEQLHRRLAAGLGKPAGNS